MPKLYIQPKRCIRKKIKKKDMKNEEENINFKAIYLQLTVTSFHIITILIIIIIITIIITVIINYCYYHYYFINCRFKRISMTKKKSNHETLSSISSIKNILSVLSENLLLLCF